MSKAAAICGRHPAPPSVTTRAKRPRWSIVLSRDNFIAAACFAFLLWASTGLRPLLPAFFAGERYLWVAADVTVIVWFVTSPGEVLAAARRNKIVICWGLFACFSMIWAPKSTPALYYGLQLVFTILMGLFLSNVQTRLRLIKLLFLALMLTQLLSLFIELAAPHMAPKFAGGGAFMHKNVLGSFMLLQIINGLCLLALGWRPFLTGIGLVMAIALLLMSGSASSLLIAVLVAGGLLPMALVYRANANLARAAAGLACMAAALGGVLILVSGYNPLKAILGGVGKDVTLTGRTILWDFGWQAFLDKPWLGHGFRAYWENEKTTVLQLRYVMQQDLEIFHNNFIEVAVAFGICGPILLVLGLVAAFNRSLAEFLATRSLAALWSVLLVIFVVTLSMAENPLFNNHGFLQALFVVAMAARDPPARGLATPQRN